MVPANNAARVPEGGRRGHDPTVFGRSVNPISTKGTNYGHHITTAPFPKNFGPSPYAVMSMYYVCQYKVSK